jgi:hypothetical protein
MSPNVFRRALLVGALALAPLAAPGVASADTASTPVGQLTATQRACDDSGAVVTVSVAGGFGNKVYTASGPGYLAGPQTFSTNASGAGSVVLWAIWPDSTPSNPDGVAVINVTANGSSGAVNVYVYCPSSKGD